jgi:hypothetical protein
MGSCAGNDPQLIDGLCMGDAAAMGSLSSANPLRCSRSLLPDKQRQGEGENDLGHCAAVAPF